MHTHPPGHLNMSHNITEGKELLKVVKNASMSTDCVYCQESMKNNLLFSGKMEMEK